MALRFSVRHTLRITTRTDYENRIYNHIIPAIGKIPLNRLSQSDLQQFYAKEKTDGRKLHAKTYGKGLSDRTIRGIHANCRTALQRAVQEGLIRTNSAVGCKLPPKKAREMQVLTQNEILRFLHQAKEEGYYELFLLEHGMDVKTLSATIGHVSSATTLDIYSHITDTMQRQAAVHIDRKIGGTDAQMPTIAREERKDTSPIEFTPYKPKIRKPGTGCVTMINDHLYEGRYTPTNAYGKRESHNIYAKTREECEEKLAEMITEVKAQIKAEKDKMTG